MAAKPEPGVHWRQIHKRLNPDLLYAEDLVAAGRTSIDLEIADAWVEDVVQMDGAKKTKKALPMLAFVGAKKRLALNVTNCKAMQSLAGTGVVQEWRGWITVVVVQATYRDQQSGKMETTDALRIAPKRPTHAPSGGRTDRDAKPANPPPAAAPVPPAAAAADLTDADRRAIELAEAEEAARG
jgi:hypothetical protein